MRTFHLLVWVGAALFCAAPYSTTDAFSNPTRTSTPYRWQRWKPHARTAFPLPSLYLQGTDDTPPTDDSLSKIEVARVKRFTVGYDKLCKSCPAKLHPRVNTLTEMILALPSKERDELMHNVAERLQAGQHNNVEEVPTRSLSEFHVDVVKPKKEKTKKKQMKIKKKKTRTETFHSLSSSAKVRGDVDDLKRLRKRDKALAKVESSKRRLACAGRLLEVTNALLSRNPYVKEPTIGTADNGWYHEIDRLQQLSTAELKMEQRKFTAQKAKYEQKIAKQNMKLYGATVSLVDAN